MPRTAPDMILLTTRLPLDLSRAWHVVTAMDHIPGWFGSHVTLEAVPGGAFREVWSKDGRDTVTSGVVTEFDPPHTIAWTWADDDWSGPTALRIFLEADGEQTRLALTHSGWAGLPENAGDRLRADHERGWRLHIGKLEAYCQDLKDTA